MRIGDTVSVQLTGVETKRSIAGKVVYIHPQRRYYTVECLVGVLHKAPIRESFHFEHRRAY